MLILTPSTLKETPHEKATSPRRRTDLYVNRLYRPTSDTLPATPETTAPEESTTTQDVGSGEVRMLSAADGGIYYQTFADSEVNHEVDIGRNLVYAVEETTGPGPPGLQCARLHPRQ